MYLTHIRYKIIETCKFVLFTLIFKCSSLKSEFFINKEEDENMYKESLFNSLLIKNSKSYKKRVSYYIVL